MDDPEYAYSENGWWFEGDYPTREAALEAGYGFYGLGVILWTGRTVPIDEDGEDEWHPDADVGIVDIQEHDPEGETP